MSYGMYISAAGADVQNRKIEVLSHNLANVDTPGFKRELAVLQAEHAEAIQRGYVSPGQGFREDVGGGVSLKETVSDFSRGPLRHTERLQDFAVEGDGFFLVRKPGEESPLLTRAGNFSIAADGTFMTDQGFEVLADNGQPLRIDGTLPWRTTPEGVIQQGASEQWLALVRPDAVGDLSRAGENLFRPLGDYQAVPFEQRRVRQGYLEMSAVEPTTAMVDLIAASRTYEANIRMIQYQDQMAGSLIGRLMRTN